MDERMLWVERYQPFYEGATINALWRCTFQTNPCKILSLMKTLQRIGRQPINKLDALELA